MQRKEVTEVQKKKRRAKDVTKVQEGGGGKEKVRNIAKRQEESKK